MNSERDYSLLDYEKNYSLLDDEIFSVMNGMNPTVVEVTPEIAKMWLGRNYALNRKMGDNRIKAYARDMQSGSWTITNDAISFSEDGRLLNGQHRLSACVMANVPFTTMVYVGMPNESFMNMDQARTRSLKDAAVISGRSGSAAVIPGIRSAVRTAYTMSEGLNKALYLSSTEVFTLFDMYPSCSGFLKMLSNKSHKNKLRRSVVYVAALIAAANGVDEEAIRCFYNVGHNDFCFPVNREFDVTLACKLKDTLEAEPNAQYIRDKGSVYNAQLDACLKAIYCFANNTKKFTKKESPYKAYKGFLQDAEAYFAKEGY